MIPDTSKQVAPGHIIEQLWYTWSTSGLNAIAAGFRIRAVSPGLNNIYSKQVKNLERYLRYEPPIRGNYLVTHPDEAPICLSLVDDGQDRVLVHKKYIGQRQTGPHGIYFIHLLAGLPADFSAKDAISCWGSLFWKTSDTSIAANSTALDPISLEDLRREIASGPNFDIEGRYLRYVIQAYLTKKSVPANRQKLYIAAPADEVAGLIWGLTSCLPTCLIQDLTFSTYEYNFSQAGTEIVGVYGLPEGQNTTPDNDVLPTAYYQTQIALNCYTNQGSSLKNNPGIEDRPLAEPFARDAAAYVLLHKKSYRFVLLLAGAECYKSLDRDRFLALYQDVVPGEPANIVAFVEQICSLSYINIYPIEQLPLSKYSKAFLEFMNLFPAFIASEPKQYKDEYYDHLEELLEKMADNHEQWPIMINLFAHLVRSEFKSKKVELLALLNNHAICEDDEYWQRLHAVAQLSKAEERRLRRILKGETIPLEAFRQGSFSHQSTTTNADEQKHSEDEPSSRALLTGQAAKEQIATNGDKSKEVQNNSQRPGWWRRLWRQFIKSSDG